MDTFFVRDEHHDSPVPPLQRDTWTEPMTVGFRRSMERWGIPVRGFALTVIDGWAYGSFELLDDPEEIGRRIERRLALPADAEVERAQQWIAEDLPEWRHLRSRVMAGIDQVDDAELAERVRAVGDGFDQLREARFTDIAIAGPFARWIMVAQERLGWDAGRAVASITPGDTSPWLDLDPSDPGPFLERHGDLSLGSDVLTPTVRERFDGTLAAGRAPAPREEAPDLEPELAALHAAAIHSQRWREATSDEMGHWLGALRRVALEAGSRLVARGELADAEDACFLELDELAAALTGGVEEVGALAAMRRRAHDEAVAGPPPPPFLGTPPAGPPALPEMPAPVAMATAAIAWIGQHLSSPPGPPAMDETTVHGVGASPGAATGTVRVVRDPSGLDVVEPGDVVVCFGTTPSWEPVLAIAGALVCDSGGFASHAALVARELGIPAVVGTKLATVVLAEGSTVTVDGTAGTVTRVEP